MRTIRRSKQRRTGAILSLELVLTLPILIGFFFAVVQFGILLAAHQQLENGCRLACRIATMPGFEEANLEATVQDALQWRTLANSFEIEEFEPGRFTGDRVELVLAVPMEAATPDMLGIIGLSIRGKELHARAVMRKE